MSEAQDEKFAIPGIPPLGTPIADRVIYDFRILGIGPILFGTTWEGVGPITVLDPADVPVNLTGTNPEWVFYSSPSYDNKVWHLKEGDGLTLDLDGKISADSKLVRLPRATYFHRLLYVKDGLHVEALRGTLQVR